MPSLPDFVLVFFLIINILLGVCTTVDLPLHYVRGLSLWEKVSHPIDAFFITLSMLLGFEALAWHSSNLFWIYCFISFITMLLTYKDEFIHQKECLPSEQVIHAIMFSCSGVSLTLGAIMILLGIGKSLFLLAFIMGSIFFFLQIILNFFVKAPKIAFRNE